MHTRPATTILSLCAAAIPLSYALGGTLTVQFGSAMDVIEGNVTNTYAKNATFTPTAIPCVYKMRMGGLAAGGRTFAITGTDQIHGANYYRFPQYGDDGWVRVALDPYPSSDTTITLTAHKVSKVYYVDEKNGKDSYDGTADADHIDDALGKGPKATLQAAHDAATAGSTSSGFPVVYVAPGFYSNGGAVATYSSTSSNRRLVSSKNIAFIATEGAEKTFIVGAPDTNAADGFGDAAVSGVYMSTSSNPAYLQGFTITGCYSPATQTGIGHYGTAFCSSSHRVACIDCVISNNFAKVKYPAACYGTYQRTKFIENKSPSFVTFYGTFISCVFAGNRITSGNSTSFDHGLHNQSHSYFCTYDLGDADYPDGRRRLNNTSGISINSALIYKMPNPAADQLEYWHACQTIDDPIFADATARDYRLGALSPALDVNSYETDLNAAMRRVMTSDIDGRMPVLRGGKMRLGAVWNDPPLPVTEIIGVGGGVSASGASAGTNVVSSADQITVTASDAHPLLGFEVNGEMVAASEKTYTFTPSLTGGAVNSVKAIYSSDWYVDCVNGDDANFGTAAEPKRTIRAATTNALSGDVIHVAPGTYGAQEGAAKYKAAASSLCRVIIPADVTIESTEGAEKTFVTGAPAADGDANAQGNGPGAIRCVYAHNGATLTGFTLTGGHTAANKDADNYDTYGAALLTGSDKTARINDCIISNNYSHYATIFRSTVRRSRIIGNIGGTESGTTADAPAGSGCTYISCIIDGNRGNATVAYSGRIESSTLGTGNRMHNNGSAQTLYNNSGNNIALNSLFLYSEDRFQGTVYATNCIFRCATKTNLSADNCANCLFSQTAGKVNVTDFKPNPGSIAIDAGSNEIARIDIANETDILGTPRALNGRIDIGAVEYDWRPTFSAEIPRRFTVTYASPSVTTNATRGLLVPDGAVAGTIEPAGQYALLATVTGGSLTVYVGGKVVATSASLAGEQEIRFSVHNAADEIRFVFTPDAETPGAAVLKGIAGTGGTVLYLR